MSTDVQPNDWSLVDPWWQAYADSIPVVQSADAGRALISGRLADSWGDLDPWWDVYTETGHATAERIAEGLEQSNDGWKDSDAPFDTDPLAADLTRQRLLRGPLQPSKEVQWSRWLAQLLRPSAELVSELFGVEAAEAPSKVTREDRLPKEEEEKRGFRRPDVLVFHGDRGVSIEVKLSDENYKKTAETAALVEERHPDREWSHALLLPKVKQNRLESIVEAPVVNEPDKRIKWEDPGHVDIVYWRDVTAAIRSLLRRGAVVDAHWASNAYLFCAVAEQQIIGFQPRSVIERLAAPTNVVDAIQPIELADTLEEQLTHLRETEDP